MTGAGQCGPSHFSGHGSSTVRSGARPWPIRNTLLSLDLLLTYAVKSHARHRRHQPERLERIQARLCRSRAGPTPRHLLGAYGPASPGHAQGQPPGVSGTDRGPPAKRLPVQRGHVQGLALGVAHGDAAQSGNTARSSRTPTPRRRGKARWYLSKSCAPEEPPASSRSWPLPSRQGAPWLTTRRSTSR